MKDLYGYERPRLTGWTRQIFEYYTICRKMRRHAFKTATFGTLVK